MSQSPDFILTLQRWCPRIPGLQTFSERNDSARAATAKARSSEQSGWKFMPIENSVLFHKSSVKSQIFLFTKGSYFCQGRHNRRRFENAVGLDLLNFPI